MADDWLLDSKSTIKELEEAGEYLQTVQALVDDAQTLVNNAASDYKYLLDKATDLAKQHHTVVEALRSENKIYGDIEIPTLTAAHQLVLERYRSHCAIEIMRQVDAHGKGEV
jgi:hypothetical protein